MYCTAGTSVASDVLASTTFDSEELMNASLSPTKLDVPTDERHASQLGYLCHFLEVFASMDPVSRAAASQYGERLRDEGCDSSGVIRIAATALLVAIEREIEEKTTALNWSPASTTSSSSILADSHDGGEERHDQAA